jgi:predicted DNA-binding protein with PD1-like motif
VSSLYPSTEFSYFSEQRKVADHEALEQAVVSVFHMLTEPAADYWTQNDQYRHKLMTEIVGQWGNLTTLDTAYFPYSVDHVVRVYCYYRKRSPEVVARIREHYGV